MATAVHGMNGAIGAQGTPKVEARLTRAAHEFEAQMMKELLAPMTRKDASMCTNEGEDTGILGEFAAESLAGALSAGGGLGIADRVIRALSGSGHVSAHAPVVGKAQDDVKVSIGK